ncbi:MAG TPA: hypothetical protein VN039_08915, partial [Nitrospira sp.]|nr:hypothetical protein [Nitrospira sp.]
LRPYWVLLKAPEIIDWDIDPFERLLYLKRKEITSGRNQRNARRVYEKYTEWFPDRVDITYVDVTNAHEPKIVPSMGTTVPNRVGEIPIQIVRYERSKRYPYMGNSFLRDFSNNNLQVMNLTSLIDEFNYKQCFNILAKEEDANALPLRDGNDGVVGVGNVMEYPKGAKPPAYITPPADPAKFMQSERDYIIQQMFKRAAQDMMSELFNGEGASGFSQAQSFAKTVPFISNRADTLEAAENALMTRTLKYLNKTWDGKIKYKDRYELTNITDALTQLLMLFRDLQLPSETFVKEELKRLVHEMDGKLPTDTLNKVLHEIDELDFDEWQEVQKEALVGKPSSPGEQNQPKSTGTTAEAASEAKAQTASTSKIRNKNNK